MTDAPLAGSQPFGTGPERGGKIAIGPDLLWFRLASVSAPMGGVNVWALRDGQSWVLVDTGYADSDTAAQWDRILAQLDGPVSRIVCTHFHPDHVGQVGRLIELLDVPLSMTMEEWSLARGMDRPREPEEAHQHARFLAQCGLEAEQVERFASTQRPRMTTGLPEHCDILVPGANLDVGGNRWTIQVGGGHSPAGALLVNDHAGVAIVGDELMMRITPHVGADHRAPDADPLRDYLNFLKQAEDFDPRLLALPGHGPAFTDIPRRAREIAAHHHERLDVLWRALERPSLCTEMVVPMFGRALSGIGQLLGVTEVLAHLNHLVATDRAVRSLDEDGFFRFIRS